MSRMFMLEAWRKDNRQIKMAPGETDRSRWGCFEARETMVEALGILIG